MLPRLSPIVGRPSAGNRIPTPECCSREEADTNSPRRGLPRDPLHPSRQGWYSLLSSREGIASTPLLPTWDAEVPAAERAALPRCQLLHCLGLFLLLLFPSSTASTLSLNLRRPYPPSTAPALPPAHQHPPGRARPRGLRCSVPGEGPRPRCCRRPGAQAAALSP